MTMRTHSMVGLSVGVLSALLGGCEETVEGKYLDTEGIAMVVDVTATDDSSSEMKIEFLVGGDESNTYVDLADDKVIASGGDQAKMLAADDIGRYDADFHTGAADTEYTVSLDRVAEDKKDAPDSSGTLPEPFTLALDMQGDVSRQDPLTVTWDPSGTADEVKVDVDGDCVFYTFDSGEDDDGSFTFPANDFIFGGDPADDDKGSCEATVTITRTRFGETDPVFDSESKFRLHQVRSLKFNSVP